MRLDQTHIVLLRPRRASNLGAVARAMKNFGLQRLSLVQSEIGSWADAWRMAVQAHDVLQGTSQAADLESVLGEDRWVVGTTNRPLPGQSLLSPRQLAELAARRGAPTLLFGDEESGLNHRELLRCHDLSMIPVARAQSSLNLAQAVVVYAAALFNEALAQDPATDAAPVPAAPPPASAAMLGHLERTLRDALLSSEWADSSRPRDAVAELMQPFYRAALTEREVGSWLVALSRIVRR
jgi:tRNA/rRNA methyltransferase